MENDLDDSPIFYLASLISRLCGDTVHVSDIGIFVEPILDLCDTEPIQTNIYCEERNDKQKLKERLRRIYSDKIIVSIYQYEFSIIFNTKKAFNHFVNICKVYQNTLDATDVIRVDIGDMLNNQSIYKGKIRLYFDSYATDNLLPKILTFSNY